MTAAEASRCAGEQGKYWPMRDELMQHSNELSPAVIENAAQASVKDMSRYRGCMESRRYYSEINADKDAGRAVLIPGTPGFIIGKSTDGITEGKRVLGARPLEEFEKIIEEALRAKQ
jgi:protein-disulfide isomerase